MSADDAASAGKGRGGKGGHHETIVKRGRSHAHDDDHGGSWKVAFADFCLALMCLFLVLWLLNAREDEAVRDMGRSTMFEGSTGLLDGQGGHIESLHVPPEATRVYETREDLEELAERLRQLGEEAGLEENLGLEVTDAGLRVMLHDTERRGVFRLGSAIPTERFRDLLRRLGTLFAGVGNPILVVGHTDAVPYRSAIGTRSNWHLSSERALSARTLLLDGGMPSGAILQSVGMADNAPLTPDDPDAAVNRRIEFMILGPARARAIRQMFGVPDNPTPLIDGVQAVGRMPGNAPAEAQDATP